MTEEVDLNHTITYGVLMAFHSAAGTRGTMGHSIQSKQVLGMDETPAQGPQFSLGGRTKDLWKSGLPCPHGQRNSVLREEFRGLIVARTSFSF
ncbi:hypothetical protein V6N13_074280 [Hibiscus sabdariffa]